MNTEVKLKAALYARVSSDEQANEGVSIEAQQAALKAYAKAMGWDVYECYVDGGFSGGTDNRPAFKRMLRDAGEKRFDIIATCKLDRFFRNLRLLLNYLEEMRELDIKFISTQEGLDTASPIGKFAVQMMGVIAEFEKDRIGERVKDSRHHILSKGEWPGGSTLYGYRWRNKERKWEIVPEEAGMVRKVFDLYLKERLGMIPIRDRLNDQGILTRKGGPWHVNSIRQMLSHPAYKGEHPVGIKVPPIIDPSMWQKAQNKRQTARNVQLTPKGWLLQGMVFCGKCGHALKCLKKTKKAPAYYACRGRVEKKRYKAMGESCTLPFVRADDFEWSVWRRVKKILNEPKMLFDSVTQALHDLEASRTQFSTELLDLDKKLDATRLKAERLGLAFADGMVPEAIYKTKSTQLKKQTDTLLKRRGNLSPSETMELAILEDKIDLIKEIIEKGRLSVTEFGMFASYGDMYTPVGYNAWRETDGKLAMGEVWEDDYIRIEGTDLHIRGINAPSEFWEADPEERGRRIKQNMRAILQFFNIKVYVYSNRVEIRGMIPTQILTEPEPKNPDAIAPIIKSAKGAGGMGTPPSPGSRLPPGHGIMERHLIPAPPLTVPSEDAFRDRPQGNTAPEAAVRSHRPGGDPHCLPRADDQRPRHRPQ